MLIYIVTIFLKSWPILGPFCSTILVEISLKVQRIAVHKMATTLFFMSSECYDVCFIHVNSLRRSHTNFPWSCNTIDFDQLVWWSGFWGLYFAKLVAFSGKNWFRSIRILHFNDLHVRWPNAAFARAFADAIFSTCTRISKNKHAVSRAIILFAQHPHYLC